MAERVSCSLAESSRVATEWWVALSASGVVPFAVVSWLWPRLGVTGGVVCVAAVIGGGLGGSELLLACC